MSKKRVKVFSSGNYPQGDYPPERVKKIFGNATKSNAIFIHTSKWKGNSPPKVGEFSGFELVNNGNKVDVFANIELNEKGKVYHSDNIFKGISVEIGVPSGKRGITTLRIFLTIYDPFIFNA